MYRISKRLEVAGAHHLNLPYESKCNNLHGHNWIITIYCEAEKLTDYGMVIDFTRVKKSIHDLLDHQNINEILPDINPTAENMARIICNIVTELCETGRCYKVTVQESEGNIAEYEED